jgi:hypothetical protein
VRAAVALAGDLVVAAGLAFAQLGGGAGEDLLDQGRIGVPVALALGGGLQPLDQQGLEAERVRALLGTRAVRLFGVVRGELLGR